MNKTKFNEMMNIFAKVYEKTIETEVLSIYFRLFKEIPDNKVNHIIRECLKKCHFFPRPADIFSFFDEYYLKKGEMRTTTEEEIERSRQGIKKLRENFKDKKELVKIGEVIKDIRKNNRKEVNENGYE